MPAEKKWETNLDKTWLNPFKDAPQTPEQVAAVKALMDHLQSFNQESPGITSMLHCLAVYFYFDAINFCDMYLEAHDPDYILQGG